MRYALLLLLVGCRGMTVPEPTPTTVQTLVDGSCVQWVSFGSIHNTYPMPIKCPRESATSL